MNQAHVLATGPLATVQDLGRGGHAHLGVPRSGGADRGALRLANRLVGNPESAAVIEVTLGGLRLRAAQRLLAAVTGAVGQVTANGRPVGIGARIELPAGAELSVGFPESGCRSYVAIRGGVDVPPVLGSRSTDILSGLGPPPLAARDVLDIGAPQADLPPVALAPVDTRRDRVITLDMFDGPRRDLLAEPACLVTGAWEVGADSNRVGVRLSRPAGATEAPARHRSDAGELASEGLAHGAVQVPPTGNPVIFLADHPVTGGYPVAGVLTARSLDAAAQLVAGSLIRFRDR